MNVAELARHDQAATDLREGLCTKCEEMEVRPVGSIRLYKIVWNESGNVDYMALCEADADFAREHVAEMVTLTAV